MLRSVFILLILFSSLTHYAKADEWEEKKNLASEKAKQIIADCWAISEEARSSPNTSVMRSGAVASAECMRDYILLLTEMALFQKDEQAQQEIETSLQKIWDGAGRLSWVLDNQNDFCPCGTMMHLSAASAVANEMEDILKKTFRTIAFFNPDFLKKDLP